MARSFFPLFSSPLRVDSCASRDPPLLPPQSCRKDIGTLGLIIPHDPFIKLRFTEKENTTTKIATPSHQRSKNTA
jgi:hypothetical protein